MGNIKFFNSKIIQLFFRFILGSIFIYAGIYKISNPQEFFTSIKNLRILSSQSINTITFLLPWVELFLGVLLITGILKRYIALISTILLLIFIVVTISSTFNGGIGSCGCFPESSILNSYNPFIIVIRNFVFIIFGIAIIFLGRTKKSKLLIFLKKHTYEFVFVISMAFLVSVLLISFAKINYRNKYISSAIEERHEITKKIENIKIKNLPKFLLQDKNGEILNSYQFEKKYIVFLIINTLECTPCLNEAIFIEKLNNKFNDNIKFYGIVPRIGKNAVSNFKTTYSLNFHFFQDINRTLINELEASSYPIKILVSPNRKILNIDPPTFGVKSFQNYYENLLKTYLEKDIY